MMKRCRNFYAFLKLFLASFNSLNILSDFHDDTHNFTRQFSEEVSGSMQETNKSQHLSTVTCYHRFSTYYSRKQTVCLNRNCVAIKLCMFSNEMANKNKN